MVCLSALATACIGKDHKGTGGGEGGGGSTATGPATEGGLGTPLIALGEQLKADGKCGAPAAARQPIRRISRIEYNNAVGELFGINNHPADGFVPEEKTGVTIGFNTNIQSAVSSLAIQQYLSSAETIAESVASNPGSTGCQSVADAACIKSYLTARARRAWRGTLPDDEKTQLLADYDSVAKDLGADQALRFGIESILLSPRFLYTVELGSGSGDVLPLTGSEMAGRLAATLWRSVPDDALLQRADSGALDTSDGVMSAARTMLNDGRATSMLADYARQWVDVEGTTSLTRDNMVWPDFKGQILTDLLGETEHFFNAVAADPQGSFKDLLTADYTMANASVASFYGLSGPTGTDYQKVSLPGERHGVLTQASVLATHAHFNRESIVFRGKLVRFQLLCDPVKPPPGTVDTTLKALASGMTERDLAEAHASIPLCNGCHKMMDPIGYGFGAFDAVGLYKPNNGEDISGTIEPPALTSKDDVSGTFNGPGELATKLANSQHAQQCYVIQAMRYALGRNEASGDACSAAAAWDQFHTSGLNVKEAIVAIVGSDTFRHRTAAAAGGACQ